jgi:hypothetical protein
MASKATNVPSFDWTSIDMLIHQVSSAHFQIQTWDKHKEKNAHLMANNGSKTTNFLKLDYLVGLKIFSKTTWVTRRKPYSL